jgi:hypothetical protein
LITAWIEKSVDLTATVEKVIQIDSPANVILLRNHNSNGLIYLSPNKVSASNYDSVAMPGSWGNIAQKTKIQSIHLMSSVDIAAVKIICMETDTPDTYIAQMMRMPIGQVQVVTTEGLKATDLNIDEGTKNLNVDTNGLKKEELNIEAETRNLLVSIAATVGLKAADLHVDEVTKNLTVEVASQPINGFTWQRVAAAAGGDIEVKNAEKF